MSTSRIVVCASMSSECAICIRDRFFYKKLYCTVYSINNQPTYCCACTVEFNLTLNSNWLNNDSSYHELASGSCKNSGGHFISSWDDNNNGSMLCCTCLDPVSSLDDTGSISGKPVTVTVTAVYTVPFRTFLQHIQTFPATSSKISYVHRF